MRRTFLMRTLFLAVLAVLLPAYVSTSQSRWTQPSVLVYTKNQVGKGLYVHDNIATSVEALKKLGFDKGFDVAVSDNSSDFTDANLKRYKVVVFDNVNNEILDNEEQKAALQHYVHNGGG